MGNIDSRRRSKDHISFDSYVSHSDYDPAEFSKDLRGNLSRLIIYAESADQEEQKKVAERLANEAVNPARQSQLAGLGGLELAFLLARSTDVEVSIVCVNTAPVQLCSNLNLKEGIGAL